MRAQIVTCTLLALVLSACSGQPFNTSAEENQQAQQTNSPAFFVFNYTVSAEARYDVYLTRVGDTLGAYGAEVLVADYTSEVIEGNAHDVTVVLKFESTDVAKKWYESAEYQEIVSLRLDSSSGVALLANAGDR
ncbi:MAG: DUF1330 domain-containing protein [Pseudomonadota bacterium]